MTGASTRTSLALADILDGMAAWRFWTMLGWNDIKQRYRRTFMGPLWITSSMAMMVTCLGLIYGSIFKVSLADYLIYLSAGIVCWLFISSSILEGANAFIAAEGIIKQSPIPFTIYVFRVVWRNVMVLMHNLVVVVVIFALFRTFSPAMLITLPLGLLLVVGNLSMIGLMLAILCTRFRDLPQILASLMQVLFYVTPVLYEPSQLPGKLQLIARWNPLYHMIEVLRRPMTGELPDTISYVVTVSMLVIGVSACVVLFGRFRSRIAYWL